MVRRDAPTLVFSAALAHRPGRGGHAWFVLNWLLGLRRLGYRTRFLDRVTSDMVGPDSGGPADTAAALRWLHDVFDPFGLGDDIAVLTDGGTVLEGPPRGDLLARVRDSAGLIDVMGFCDDHEVLAAAPVRVGLDIDPGFGQIWAADGLADPFAHHDRLLTVGLNVGRAGCGVPDLGREWIATLPPVVLEHWPDLGPGAGPVTSVGAWRGPYGPLERDGTRLGLRVHAARPLLDLPARTGVPFTVAYDVDPGDDDDRRALVDHGWDLVDPAVVAADPAAYASFVGALSAELCVANEIYTRLHTGWFSDRSAIYLASGRPVVMTDTGLADHLPHDAGLLLVDGLDDAAAAVREVTGDPALHSKAARNLAEEHLDSDQVLDRALRALELR
jgi:hypothetical protein